MPWTLIAPFLQSVQHVTPHTSMQPSPESDGLHAWLVPGAGHEPLDHKCYILIYGIFFPPYML